MNVLAIKMNERLSYYRETPHNNSDSHLISIQSFYSMKIEMGVKPGLFFSECTVSTSFRNKFKV